MRKNAFVYTLVRTQKLIALSFLCRLMSISPTFLFPSFLIDNFESFFYPTEVARLLQSKRISAIVKQLQLK